MSYTREQIADALDLAVLKPTATAADVRAACALAVARKIKSVCVAPVWVPMASDLYGNVCAVIAFPHGNTLPEAKYAEAVAAMDCGAKELDVVVNYGLFLDSGHHNAFWDVAGIVKAAHPRGVLVKTILETLCGPPHNGLFCGAVSYVASSTIPRRFLGSLLCWTPHNFRPTGFAGTP